MAKIVRLSERVEKPDDRRAQVDHGHLEAHAERDARTAVPGADHLVHWSALSPLRVVCLLCTSRQDLSAGPLSVSRLPSSIHCHNAHPDAGHQARFPDLDLRDVFGVYIE